MTPPLPASRLDVLLREIDLPERAYELAERRYEDLGEWIGRPESGLADYDTHIFVQGSFALGTAIRPVNDSEEYDLDFSCKLRQGVTRQTHSQEQLKNLVGAELAAYRLARQITHPLEPKNRCWRLQYRDELPFHMDIVPGIRTDELQRQVLRERMASGGVPEVLARDIARRALWITDKQHRQFRVLSPEWPSSNPGGYQLWFLSRMQPLAKGLLAEAQIDPVPIYRSKTPLQQAVQLLKRHRDAMFAHDPELKPASVILTTVAGQAYMSGEALPDAIHRILQALEAVRASDTDRILNPVNPLENFADRWVRPDCVNLHLKQNFHLWITQARRDFAEVLAATHEQRLTEMVSDVFDVRVPEGAFRRFVATTAAASITPRHVSLSSPPARPWHEQE